MSNLNKAERKILEAFRDGETTLEQLRSTLSHRVSFEFAPSKMCTRAIEKHTDPATPGIPVERKHIVAAYRRWKSGQISDNDLSDWAAMLVMNDDFDISEVEQELIAEWLNNVAMVGPDRAI